jgi:hypothetical protein
MEYDHDQRDYQKQVNEAAGNVRKKADNPEQDE